MDRVGIKSEIVLHTGISKDALHVLLSVCGLFVIAFATNHSLSRPWPMLGVLFLELINEYLDFLSRGGWDRMNNRLWADSIKDVGVTMALPMLIYLFSRYSPDTFVQRSIVKDGDECSATELHEDSR